MEKRVFGALYAAEGTPPEALALVAREFSPRIEICSAPANGAGREITLEYTLLRGVNDRPEHADQLAHVAKTLRANINLIRYNEVQGLPFQRPMTDDVTEFQRLLRARHINTHIRASRGRDIAAACGQLRHESAPTPITTPITSSIAR